MLELGGTEEVIRENGQTCERRPHPHCHRRRNQRVSWQFVDTFEFCGVPTPMPVRHRPDFKKALSTFASPQESRG